VALAGDPTDEQIAALARDVVAYDQRGCLSPLAVYATGAAVRLAGVLAAALAREAHELPPGPASVAERATARVFREQAEWAGASVLGAAGGTVLRYPETRPFRPGCGRRTIEVYPLADAAALPAFLPTGAIECVG